VPGVGGLRVAPGDRFEVRFRRGGERCRPAGRGGSHPLKKVLQEQGLEPWLRDLVPLVFCNGELAAVGDLFLCEGFAAPPDAPGLALRWR
jgi:tRNA(Ile)-lysidine synthase